MSAAQASFVAADTEPDSAPIFRRDIELETGHGAVTQAVLRLSALGICEAWMNGTPVSPDLLTPGWTSYEWRIHSVEHDVTELLAPVTTIAVAVGNGWWRGRLGWIETRRYGSELAAYALLTIRYEDGFEQVVGTDDTWQVGPSDILADDFYDGQVIDARRREEAWKHPGFTDDRWGRVHAVDYPVERITPDPAPPVRRVAELSPMQVWRGPAGTALLDVGENIVGFLRLRVTGRRGQRLVLRHAEVLQDGKLATAPLRSAASTDTFVLSGEHDVFEPTFTFHGFRYAEVEGWEGDLEALKHAVTAVVISSDLEQTGTFECSVPELNTFHENVRRGMRGNFVDVPTDCPQRDERLGWTGDIAAFVPAAVFLADSRSFLTDWLADLALEQRHHGGVVPYVVPDILKYATQAKNGAFSEEPAALWSDAAVWVPWSLYEAYGDPQVLADAFVSMTAHGRRVRSLLSASGVWDSGFQYGDWLDPDAPPETPELAKADPGVVATACAYRTAVRLRESARILGRDAEAAEFGALADRLRAGFRSEYVNAERITSDCSAVYALAIAFGLLDDAELAWAGRRLAEIVQDAGHRISSGFAGTPFVTDALTSTGHTPTAYRLLLQRECPSWLYPVTMGATTIWERWDSMLPDGSINPGEMTSFNHYALGAVADWMHRVLGGLAPREPGYRRILVAPKVHDGIDWVRTSLRTSYGVAAVAWSRTGDQVDLEVTVPPGSTADFEWPGLPPRVLDAGVHRFTLPTPSYPLSIEDSARPLSPVKPGMAESSS